MSHGDENLEEQTANRVADKKITNVMGGKGEIQRAVRQVGCWYLERLPRSNSRPKGLVNRWWIEGLRER